MKVKILVIVISFVISHVVLSQEIEPFTFGEKVTTSIDEDILYSELDKLYDEFNDSCYSKKIGSRSPFINLLERALNKSGSTYTNKSKKINKSDRGCFNYIQDDMSFSFEHYYKHYCKLLFLEDEDEILQFSVKGESVAEEYYDDFKDECINNSGKKSNKWFNEWNVGLNVWSKLLSDKVNYNFKQLVIERERAQEKIRVKKLAAEKQAKEVAMNANIERQRKQEQEKLRLIAEAEKAEVEKLKLIEERRYNKNQKTYIKDKSTSNIDNNSKHKENAKSPLKPYEKINSVSLDKNIIFYDFVDVPYTNTGKFGLNYDESESNPQCEVSPLRSMGKIIWCTVIIENEEKTVDLDGKSIIVSYGTYYGNAFDKDTKIISPIIKKLLKNHKINFIKNDGMEIRVCFDNCIISVTDIYVSPKQGNQVYLAYKNDIEASKMLKKEISKLKAYLSKESAIKNSKNHSL